MQAYRSSVELKSQKKNVSGMTYFVSDGT